MKVHSTNYNNTLIEIAEDCPLKTGTVPPEKGGGKSTANLQFEMLLDNSYQYTSDEVLFTAFAKKKGIAPEEMQMKWQEYFSKGQPCFRASPLTKTYGWGIHSNEEGKIAMYGAESKEYERLLKDESVKKVKAMRSKKA